MDPSDRERINLGSGSPHGGTDGPRHDNGTPGEGDRWLRSVLENSSEIIKIVDPDGTLRYASPAFDRILGYDPEEAIGTMNVLDHVHPDDLPHVLEETEKALSEGGIATNKAEYRFLHKDGSWRWMESMGTYLLDDPAVGGVVVTSRDITERKEVEERLREAKERYRTLVEQIPAVTYIDEIDETSSAIYMSPQVEGPREPLRVVGVQARVHDLVPPGDHDFLKKVGHLLGLLLGARHDQLVVGEIVLVTRAGGSSKVRSRYLLQRLCVRSLLSVLHALRPQATESESEAAAPRLGAQRLDDPLSERELEVLTLLASGHTNAEIAHHLFVAVGTVKSHAGNIYCKLDAKNRAEALGRARELKLLP